MDVKLAAGVFPEVDVDGWRLVVCLAGFVAPWRTIAATVRNLGDDQSSDGAAPSSLGSIADLADAGLLGRMVVVQEVLPWQCESGPAKEFTLTKRAALV